MKTNPQARQTSQANPKNQIPNNLLISFAAATACSAIAVKFLKKGELALLTTFLFIPLALMCMNKRDDTCYRNSVDINPIL